MIKKLVVSAVVVLAASQANAQAPAAANTGVLQERNISLAIAVDIARGAVDACAAKNLNVSAVIVDRAGVVRATLRADRAGPHTLDSARGKAYTSASIRNNTGAIAANLEQNPAMRNVALIPGLLVLGGGVPIRAGDEVIGAIGVGGAPSGALDEECANAGIEKVKDRLK